MIQGRNSAIAGRVVDRLHPLARRMVSLILLDGPGGERDLCYSPRAFTIETYPWTQSVGGRQASGASGEFVLSPGISITSGQAWTISGLCRFPIDSNSNAVFARTSAPVYFGIRNVAADALAVWAGSYTNFSPTIAILTLSGVKRLTLVKTPGVVTAYLDGEFAGTAANSTTAAQSIINIYGDTLAGSRAWGMGRDFFAWDRSLTPAEVAAHAREPYAMLESEFGVELFLPIAAGGGVTIPIFHHHYRQMVA